MTDTDITQHIKLRCLKLCVYLCNKSNGYKKVEVGKMGRGGEGERELGKGKGGTK